MLARAAGQRAGMSMHQTIFVRTHLYMFARVYVRTVYALKLCCLILIAQLLLMRKHCGWLILPLPLNAARALMMRAFICIPHQRRLNGKAHVAAACGLRAFTFKLKKRRKYKVHNMCGASERNALFAASTSNSHAVKHLSAATQQHFNYLFAHPKRCCFWWFDINSEKYSKRKNK